MAIIGIDLGTTNSLAAVWQDGRAQLVPNALGEVLTPSVVGVDGNGDILVGAPAVERMLTHPELTKSVFKRYMGTDRTVRLGTKDFRPEELSSLVLRSLKRDVEEWSGEKIDEAIISVPAYFNDTQRKATKTAGELAGLKVERLINEPTAAALAYGLHGAQPESQFLVFDLGGGTFDVTILELFEGVMEVRASAGDNFLGGEDFVSAIIDHFITDVGEGAGITKSSVEADPRLLQALRRTAESAKRALTDSPQAIMKVRHNDKLIEFRFGETELKAWAEPLLGRLRNPVERALRDARIRPSQLSEIILVGGATRIPLIRALVTRLFGRFPNTTVHPDEAVALGAAVQAGLKMRDRALREVVLTDVCPYSLGVEVAELERPNGPAHAGLFQPIIERNTVIPASRVHSFSTIRDNQTTVDINVFQGEARLVKDNIALGKIRLNVKKQPAGREQLLVRFTYDINGILEVETTIGSTGEKQRLVIEESPGTLSRDEIEECLLKLGSLKIHPFDQVENRTAMAKADRLYEQSLGHVRQQIQAQVLRFSEAMSTQDPETIGKARRELLKLLAVIDSEGPHGSQ